jgi:hypothetical protein
MTPKQYLYSSHYSHVINHSLQVSDAHHKAKLSHEVVAGAAAFEVRIRVILNDSEQ